MNDDTPQTAPALGEPTDTPVGEDAAHAVDGTVDAADGTSRAEKTMDTPDALGGTGGEQAGGAG